MTGFSEASWWALGLLVAAALGYGAPRLIRAARARLAIGHERPAWRDVADPISQNADGAMRLLAAAGIETHVDMDVRLPAPVVDVLAQALGEGITNVLRHSEARTCSITATRSEGSVRLEIINDGARTPQRPGKGLSRLTELVRAERGCVTAGPTPDGGFRLLVELPEEAT